MKNGWVRAVDTCQTIASGRKWINYKVGGGGKE